MRDLAQSRSTVCRRWAATTMFREVNVRFWPEKAEEMNKFE